MLPPLDSPVSMVRSGTLGLSQVSQEEPGRLLSGGGGCSIGRPMSYSGLGFRV